MKKCQGKSWKKCYRSECRWNDTEFHGNCEYGDANACINRQTKKESKMVLGEKSMSYAPLPERTLLYTPLPERTLPLKRRLFEK